MVYLDYCATTPPSEAAVMAGDAQKYFEEKGICFSTRTA